MEVRNWTVRSNPTIVDTDSDGVNDYHEFENQSDPTCNDTDGDYILDCDELRGELTQIDAAPPQFLKWETTNPFFLFTSTVTNQLLVQIIEHKDGNGFTTSKEIKITVHLYDPSGLNYARFMVEGQEDKYIYIENNQKYANLTVKFNYDDWRGFNDGFDIKVQAFDLKNNGNSTKTHLDGFCEGVTNAIIKLFKWIGDAVLKALSALFDWIWGVIRNMINGFMNSIGSALSSVFQQFYNIIRETLDSSILDIEGKENEVTTYSKFISKTIDWIFLPLVMLSALFVILNAIEVMGTVATAGGLAAIAQPIAALAVTLILSTTVQWGMEECLLAGDDGGTGLFYKVCPVFNDWFGKSAKILLMGGMLWLHFKDNAHTFTSAGLAICALLLTTITALLSISGWYQCVVDIVALVVMFLSFLPRFRAMETALKVIAPITSLFATAVKWTSRISTPIAVISHVESWGLFR
jgi:hypothetical protein